MKIYLIRHGDADYDPAKRIQGRVDGNLSAKGIKQAELLGRRLQMYNIRKIYCSSLTRVRQTAEIIGRHTGIDCEIRDELMEIFLGKWEGLDTEGRKALDPGFYGKWERHTEDLPYPGGECGEDVRKRSMKLIDHILDNNYSSTAVITSGGVIKILLSAFLDMRLERRFRIETGNCGISIVEYDYEGRQFKILAVNDTSHLENMS